MKQKLYYERGSKNANTTLCLLKVRLNYSLHVSWYTYMFGNMAYYYIVSP